MAWLMFLIFLSHIILSIVIAEATKGQMLAKPGCPEKCGSVDIPYPFGIGPDCSFSKGFELACNTTSHGSVPYHGIMEVLSIIPSTAQARLYNNISWQCYNPSTNKTTWNAWYYTLIGTIYRLSSLDNMFVVIGCETLAFNKMWQSDSNRQYPYRTGCVSTCYRKESLTNGSCSGNGCCQTSIPPGINYYNISFDMNYRSYENNNWDTHCSYAVIMETSSFYFRTSYISTIGFWSAHNGTVPVVLDWSVGTETCKAAQANTSKYACVSNNSVCIDSTNGQGYVCNCSKGYQGNPYLPDGCQDIDECLDDFTCSGNICENNVGGYSCSCPPGKEGDAIRNACYPVANNRSLSQLAKLAIGASSSLFVLVLLLFSAHIIHEKRKLIKIRDKYFQQYGGRLLLEEMKSNHGNSFNIFTEEELKEATNNFDETNMLGQGGNGTVYKGTLKSNDVVAIKRCKVINEKNKKEFGKEMLILSEINHMNIVRILGCCLEVEIPILVYEFIPNGTLFDLLHSTVARISLSIRLRIAQEAADALAYLHSWASPPIVHCDVKSANILLDENYVAKVSDFGASALAPSDEDQFLTMVQGTCGYLDPLCMQTGQLTVKSDVYSFGVVLLELVTRKKAFYFDGPEERSLVSAFLSAVKENKLEQILDDQILDEENMNLIKSVAELAKECLNMEGEKRPEMRNVAEGLANLRKSIKHSWGQDDGIESESLLGGPSTKHEVAMTSYHSLETRAMLAIETGR